MGVIDAIVDVVHNVVVWFQTLVPGGFGLLIIPLAVLGLISLWVARNR
jgi:hypothetical protein